VKKRRREQEASMEWNTTQTGDNTGRNIELMGDNKKKAYL